MENTSDIDWMSMNCRMLLTDCCKLGVGCLCSHCHMTIEMSVAFVIH